ncbi:MAG: T9SS type A sorting domain-containing protein [Bacteroidales bacterium]|nr:T9SS type A sorting domain-containing protein [Bacteroidales bacterium]
MKFNDFYILFLIAFAFITIKPTNAQKQTSASSIVYTTGYNLSQTNNQREDFWIGGSDSSIYYQSGFVGIGTSSPEANLHVQGNMNVGNNPHTGSIIGENAFVGGEESEASGLNSFAYGDRAKAANTGAFAVGLRAEANGRYSTAIGRASMANHDNAIALGYATEASATNAIVIGKHARASVSNAYIIGSGVGLSSSMLVNEVDHSLIIGFESTVPTFFVGPSDGAGTTGRIGIGNMTDPQAKLHIYSDVDEAATLKLEHQLTGTNRYAEIGLGTHRIYAGNFDNMVFETPDSTKHFAFENGKVGIGTSSPEANLHVQGNMNVGNNPHTGILIGENAFVGGQNSIASGNYSFAFGRESKATHMNAVAIGFKAEATSEMAVSIGYINKARAESTYLFGERLSAGSSGAFVIGRGVSSENSLQNNVNSSLMIGFNSTVPTFFVGPSDGIGTTGRIGIGNVTEPQAKLHIRADEEEDASLKLEASAGGRSMVILSESHKMSYETDENLHFSTAQNKAFVFHQGDIFIEDIQSGIIMRSPNGQCWRGRVNDQGMLAFEQTECPTTGTALQEVGETKHLLKVFPNPASNRMEVVTVGISGPYTLRLIAATGNLMLEQQSHLSQTQLNVQNLPAGAYILMLVQDEQLKDSVKVLVE